MLGRKDYTQEELDNTRTAVKQLLAAYKQLAKAARDTDDPKVTAALETFEPLLFNSTTLALDRCFVHRLRSVTGKDGNPLNELELLTESLMNNHGVLRGNNVIKFEPDESVLELDVGDRIAVSAAQFEQLSTGVFAELDAKYVK